MNVRPHPHIGIATVTFLFTGEIMHRDSLGYTQPITPGAVNLMTAGRGIVHSERTRPELVESGQQLHGIQSWMALPDAEQDRQADFAHYPADALPSISHAGVTATLIIGSAFGKHSPVTVAADTLYISQHYLAGAQSTLPAAAERALYLISGNLSVGDREIVPGTLALLNSGEVVVKASEASHCMIIGGEAIGPRYLWWNLVHTDAERIEQAKRDWVEGRFEKIAGDDEFIPLPQD
jgi:redox-sensitive bicupin YhaK (pirin superfamily)